MKTTALIAAAGAGQRMGMGRPKAFLLLDGRPLVAFSLALFQEHPLVDSIILMAPASMLQEARSCAASFSKVAAVAAGGERRQDTVALGLAIMGRGGAADDDIVLVHDAARPFASRGLVDAVLEAARRAGAAVPGVAPSDTVKQVSQGRVAATLDRATLALIQTPQGFRLGLLQEALRRHAAMEVTDDAALLEALGHPVEIVPGDPGNMKITGPGDLTVAEALRRARGDSGGSAS